MSARYEAIAAAFLKVGAHIPASGCTLDGRRRMYAGFLPDGRRALFSYGPHFPALIQDERGWLLNTEDYQPSDGERCAAGWRGSMYGQRRRVRYSPATRNQLGQVRDALARAGKADTGERVFDAAGCEYAVWE